MDAQFVTFDASKLFAEMVSDHLFQSYLNFHNAMQSFTKTSGCAYKHGRTAYMKADSARRSTLVYRHFTLKCTVTDCPSSFKVSAKGCYLRVIHSNMLHKHPVQIAAEETQPIVADHTELFQEHFQGRNFDSFESLQESVRQFENLTGSRFVIRLCRLLKEDHELAGTVKYRSVTLGCTHGHTYELKPQRRTFTETRHSGCKARINVNLKQGRLIVTSACQEHNHLTIPATFNRDLETQDAREYLELVSTVKPSNYRLAKELGLLYGSQSSYQRVRRMQAYARQRKRANCQRKGRGRNKSDDDFREPVQRKASGYKANGAGTTTSYESVDQLHSKQSPEAVTATAASEFEATLSDPDAGREDTPKSVPSSEPTNFRLLDVGLGQPVADEWISRGDFLPLSTTVDLPGELVVEAASGRVFHRPTGRLVAPITAMSSQEAVDNDPGEAGATSSLLSCTATRPAIQSQSVT